MDYQEQRFRAQDDLELYYRDYGDRGDNADPVPRRPDPQRA